MKNRSNVKLLLVLILLSVISFAAYRLYFSDVKPSETGESSLDRDESLSENKVDLDRKSQKMRTQNDERKDLRETLSPGEVGAEKENARVGNSLTTEDTQKTKSDSIAARMLVFKDIRKVLLTVEASTWTPESLQSAFTASGVTLTKKLQGAPNSRRIELHLENQSVLNQLSALFWVQPSGAADFSHVRFDAPMDDENAKKEIHSAEESFKEKGWKIDQTSESKVRALKNGFEMMVYFKRAADASDESNTAGTMGLIFEHQLE
jgi:hypothetical protein